MIAWFWRLLFSLLATVSIYFLCLSLSLTYHFYMMNATTTTTTIHYETEENFLNIFYPVATYSYVVDGKNFSATETLSSPQALSEEYLEENLRELEKEKHKVSYDPKNPARSTLEKHFPYREITYAIITLSISFYFVTLFYYVKSRNLR